MSLPIYTALGAIPPADCRPEDVAGGWLEAFARAASRHDVDALTTLFLPDGWWRDLLSMTWDFRTFHGRERIRSFLEDRLKQSKLSNIKLSEAVRPKLAKPYPDLAWVQVMFTFDTAIGFGNAVVRLVYLPSQEWKAFTLVTSLDRLKGAETEIDFAYPEREDWTAARAVEQEFAKEDPTVLIVGAGQSGLGLAARLKLLGIKSLIVERDDRVGDLWRTSRYTTLRLHDPMWKDQFPLFSMPEPPLWPVFIPGAKMADWMEAYVKLLDLNVWTSSTIRDPKFDPQGKSWTVTVVSKNGRQRALKTRHLVWATGLAGGQINMPKYDGMVDFKGPLLHSSQFRRPEEFRGKKVAVIGTGVSGHDICRDLHLDDVDVTMVQRGSTYVMSVKNGLPLHYKELFWAGSPPTEVADILFNSFPAFAAMPLAVRLTSKLAELDKDLLEGLRQVGFRTNLGIEGSGLARLALRAGGTYLNVGTSDMIIDGRIKLKNDSPIASFVDNGIQFEDGSILDADAVICATGYGNMRDSIAQVFDEDVMTVLRDNFWDFNEEGEVNGIWRDSGHDRFYVAVGNFSSARFFSKMLALQIKAIEMGVLKERYALH